MKTISLGAYLRFLVPAVLAIAGGYGATVSAQPLVGGSFIVVGAPATGGTMSGGTFRLTGYVASAGAETSSGEGFDLTCGLIGVYVVTGGDVPLRVQLTPTGQARIWWAPGETDHQLESTPALGQGADWQPVSPAPSGNEYFTPPVEPARYFRLRKL
jgi:hypothetical protein